MLYIPADVAGLSFAVGLLILVQREVGSYRREQGRGSEIQRAVRRLDRLAKVPGFRIRGSQRIERHGIFTLRQVDCLLRERDGFRSTADRGIGASRE
jgi:hypothetical protein